MDSADVLLTCGIYIRGVSVIGKLVTVRFTLRTLYLELLDVQCVNRGHPISG
jgi:hypothetical protein